MSFFSDNEKMLQQRLLQRYQLSANIMSPACHRNCSEKQALKKEGQLNGPDLPRTQSTEPEDSCVVLDSEFLGNGILDES